MLIYSLFLCLVLSTIASAQLQKDGTSWNSQPGGKYLPSQGNIHIILVFAEFPDDSLDRYNSEWPKGSPPRRANTWIDSVWSTSPTPWSLTDYFEQMSLGTFRVTGTTHHVIVPHTRASYREQRKTRKDIHRDIIEQLDSATNFAAYDRWETIGEYQHREKPDGIVDMMVIIWRNIDEDLAGTRAAVRGAFGFIGDEADLGFGSPVAVDNGQRMVKMGYGIERKAGKAEPAGSGVTLSKTYVRLPFESMLQTTIHEIGHYLMGGMEYHTGFGCWGMVSTYGIRMFVPNAFERHRLGWISLRTMSGDTAVLHNVPLPDYVTTGEAVRFVVDSTTGQYFFVENHQGISRWDKTMYIDSIERGLYVLRQDLATDSAAGPGHQLRLIPADGRYKWNVGRMELHPCCGATLLPVFKRGEADRDSGFHDCDHVPYTDPATRRQRVSEVILVENDSGTTVHVNSKAGDGHDAFHPNTRPLFSPWSNPSSQDKHRRATGFGFEITAADTTEYGVVYKLSLYAHTAQLSPPAPVQRCAVLYRSKAAVLSWQTAAEPDIASYKVYRIQGKSKKLIATVAHKNGAQQLSFTDKSPRKDARYTVVAVDKQGLYSAEVIALP